MASCAPSGARADSLSPAAALRDGDRVSSPGHCDAEDGRRDSGRARPLVPILVASGPPAVRLQPESCAPKQTCWQTTGLRIARLVDHKVFSAGVVACTLVSLFLDDFRTAFLPKEADIWVDCILLACFL